MASESNPSVSQVAWDIIAETAPRRPIAPPARPKARRRGRQLPEIGTQFVDDQDGTVWTVENLHRKDRQVTLKRRTPIAPAIIARRFVYANDLASLYTEVPAA